MSYELSFIKAESDSHTVTTTSTTILNFNKQRKYLVIRNTGSETVYLSMGGGVAAVSGKGIVLKADEAWEMTNDNIGKGAIQAVTASSTSTLATFEATR